MQYDTLRAILKRNGSSLTKTRRYIFDLLQGKEPQGIAVLISRATGNVDRATIYRTIELFEQLGIVSRINVGWKYRVELSDIFTDHHHHMHCTNCGKVVDLPANPMLETMIETLAAKSEFTPRGHSLEIYGLCPSCAKS